MRFLAMRSDMMANGPATQSIAVGHNMADLSGRKRRRDEWEPEDCPYGASDEHSDYQAFRGGHATGVCEFHICRGVSGCRNAMLPPDEDAGAPYCANPECQALRYAALDVPYLPPEMWHRIASFLPEDDVAYLRDVSAETRDGVEMYVADRRRVPPVDKRGPNRAPGGFTQDKEAAFSSRTRVREYLSGLSKAGLQYEFQEAMRSGKLFLLEIAASLGAKYTSTIGLLALRRYGQGEGRDMLTWLERRGLLSSDAAYDELFMTFLEASQDEIINDDREKWWNGDILIWFARPRRNSSLTKEERVGRLYQMAAESHNEWVVWMMHRIFQDVRVPSIFCDMWHNRETITDAQWVMAQHVHPSFLPIETFPCAPNYCGWAMISSRAPK